MGNTLEWTCLISLVASRRCPDRRSTERFKNSKLARIILHVSLSLTPDSVLAGGTGGASKGLTECSWRVCARGRDLSVNVCACAGCWCVLCKRVGDRTRDGFRPARDAQELPSMSVHSAGLKPVVGKARLLSPPVLLASVSACSSSSAGGSCVSGAGSSSAAGFSVSHACASHNGWGTLFRRRSGSSSPVLERYRVFVS